MSNETVRRYVLKEEHSGRYYTFHDVSTGAIGFCQQIADAARFQSFSLVVDCYSKISWAQGKLNIARSHFKVVKVALVSSPKWQEVE